MRKPGGPDGMSQADAAAVYVGDGSIEAQPLLARNVLGSERFIYFDELNILEGHSGFAQGLLAGGHRSVTHEVRFNTGNGMGDNPCHRGQAQLSGPFARHEDSRSGTVIEPGRIARRHRPILLESRLELDQILHGQTKARMFVLLE